MKLICCDKCREVDAQSNFHIFIDRNNKRRDLCENCYDLYSELNKQIQKEYQNKLAELDKSFMPPDIVSVEELAKYLKK